MHNLRLFAAGSTLYPALELLYRQKTHISMVAAGGAGLCLINKICNDKLKNTSLTTKCLAGSCIITGIELATGLIVNIGCKQHVWDYSHLPMNLMGQICLPFSLLWGMLTLPALTVCKLLK